MREGLKEGAEQEVNPWQGGPFLLLKPSPFWGAGTGLSPSVWGERGQTKDNGLPHEGEQM